MNGRPLHADALTASYLRNLTDCDPLSALQALAWIDRHVNTIMTAHVHAARTRGDSWEEIGDAIGTSRQGAWNRFHDTAGDAPTLPYAEMTP